VKIHCGRGLPGIVLAILVHDPGADHAEPGVGAVIEIVGKHDVREPGDELGYVKVGSRRSDPVAASFLPELVERSKLGGDQVIRTVYPRADPF